MAAAATKMAKEVTAGRRVARILALLASGVAVGTIFFGGLGSDIPDRVEHGISRALRKKHGVVFCADFNDAIVKDLVTLSPIVCVDAPRVKTPTGYGRRILPGRKRSSILPVATTLPATLQSATYSFTIAPDTLSGQQDFVNATSSISGMLSYLLDGRVVAELHTGTNRVELSAPWPSPPGVFVNISLAIETNSAALYINGAPADSAALVEPVSLLPRRWAFPASIRYPFCGTIDDVSVWNRALRPGEIRSLCRPQSNLQHLLAPFASRMLPFARFVSAGISYANRVFDRLVPSRGGTAVMRREYPILALHTRKADERHFLRAHEKSLFNGYRTSKAAKLRIVDATYAKRNVSIEAGLDDIYGRDFVCRRPAFVLHGEFPELLGPCGAARLYPPEAHALIHPDATDILPLNARYVRLYEDKTFKGLYAIEPFDAPGSAWMARGEIKKALYFNGRPRLSDVPPQGEDMATTRRAAATVALSDNLFPWSAVEILARRRNYEKKRRLLGFHDFANAVAPVEAILGENPAPFFVTTNLMLHLAGANVKWASSDPETISRDGGVIRPDGNRHRVVTLTATDGATGAQQKYTFRVMARQRTLPTIFLHIGDLPQKERRQDFVASFLPCDAAAPVRLNGLVGAGGGLRHRGNSSYLKGVKRPMSLKLDMPFSWPDPAHPSRHIILHSGYSDPSRLKNKIAFDIFQEAFSQGQFPAPTFDLCEVFVNGEWMGVWESSRRIRDLVPEGTLLYKVRGSNNFLWRKVDTSFLDCVTHPESLDSDPYAPIADLFDFTANSPSDVFVKNVGSRFHLDNLINYQLVLAFTDNADAICMNQYFARLPGDSRFLVIPWDYDKTFLRGHRLLGNYLLRRLRGFFPGYDEVLASRWRELREGVLSDEAIFGRIDADAARLAPYMEEEWRLLEPTGFNGSFDDALATLRTAVRRQLDFMDRAFVAPQGP